ncbi:MAG TPA: hypothetical protein VH012_05595 [Acidimicrobiales bacterium]|nr:hypothetical protein [Acidimicrobiales bacterium]
MERHEENPSRRGRWGLALVPPALVLILAGCSSGTGGGTGTSTPPSANASLKSAGKAVQAAMTTYLTQVDRCASQSSPVVCLEAADHTLGDKIHDYANVLAGHRRFSVPAAEQSTTLEAAQTLANSLEILGDAQPTQANYTQVLNTFDISSAITQLQGDVTTLSGALGK